MKKFLLIAWFLIFSIPSHVKADADEQIEAESLINVEEMVRGLRVKYGIKGSVHLSRAVWQILKSFPSQEQAQQLWDTALQKAIELKNENNHAMVNVRYSVGQLLTLYTHGMNQPLWNNDRSNESVNDQLLNDYFKLSDDLKIYANLNAVWALLLKDIARRDDLQWPLSFEQSFYSDVETLVYTPAELEMVLLDLSKKLDEKELSHVFNSLDQSLYSVSQKEYILTLVRFRLSLQSSQYLGAVNGWMVLANHWIHQPAEDFNSADSIAEFIEKVDQWFLERSVELSDVDVDLPQIVELTMQKLKSSLFNANSESVNLPTSFDLVSSSLNEYMITPFRNEIRDKLEICLDMSKEFAPYPQEPININQFSGCLQDLNEWISVQAKSRELSGDISEKMSDEKLSRILQNPSWQTVNFVQSNFSSQDCLSESDQKVNPFEWIMASEILLWFVDRWPSYMKMQANADGEISPRSVFNQFINEGERLKEGFRCMQLSQAELIQKQFKSVVTAWEQVKQDIKGLKNEYSGNVLKESSDIDLLDHADQNSDYRVQDAKILPCNEVSVCGVHVELEPSRGLFNLFPNHMLLADQLKMGDLRICYDQVGWENRTSTATHLENDSVANYLGNLSLHLKGFYNEELVFDRKVTSREEMLYLFGKNDDAVLDMYCPLEIVGEMISTKLERGTFGLVPNRLTFLTASRADESQIITSNWHEGEEWQDKFTQLDSVTVVSQNDHEELVDRVQEEYLQKSSRLQTMIYQALTIQNQYEMESQQQLNSSMVKYNVQLRLFAALFELFSLDDFLTNDEIHGMFLGAQRVPDSWVLAQMYEQQLGVDQMIQNMDSRLKMNQENLNQLSLDFQHKLVNEILFRLKSRIQ